MKRKSFIIGFLLLLVVICFGLPLLQTYRVYRQERLNHELIVAIKSHDIPLALHLLKEGAYGNTRDMGEKPLTQRQIWREFINRLLHRTQPVDTADAPTALLLFLNEYKPMGLDDSTPPLSPQQHAAFVKALLEHGARADLQVKGYVAPLVLAAQSHSPESVRTLLDHGCAPDDCGPLDNSNPLAVAAGVDDIETVTVLLERGADVNAEQGTCSTLTNAIQSGNIALVDLLLKHGANINTSCYNPLCCAALEGNLAMVRFLLVHGADAKIGVRSAVYVTVMGDSEYRTPEAHHTEIMRLLLEHGASADPLPGEEHREAYGRTALFSANTEETQLLLRYGANPNAEDIHHDTPLLWAVYDGDLKKVKLLLQYGADPNHEGQFDTPLQAAAKDNAMRKRNAAMIARLKKAGAK